MKRIVFVSHDASRTGAPILLLNFIAWLKQKEECECIILLLDDGPLVPDFKKLGKVFLWSDYKELVIQSHRTPNYVLKKYLNVKIRLFKRKINQEIKLFQPDLIYVNTVASCKFISNQSDLFSGFRLVLHIHEMPFSIKKYIPNLSEHTFKIFSGIIVVNSIIEKFVLSAGVDLTRILKVPEYLNQIVPVRTNAGKQGQSLIVLGVGLGGWRKGIDLFIQTAYYLSRQWKVPFLFKWVGELSDDIRGQLEQDIAAMGIERHVIFTGSKVNLSEFYDECDIFFLSSRVDSYPMVMLEAAAHQKPIVYFKGSGGADEFVGAFGKAVDFFDPALAAKAINEIVEDQALAETNAKILFESVKDHSIELIGNQIKRFIVTC